MERTPLDFNEIVAHLSSRFGEILTKEDSQAGDPYILLPEEHLKMVSAFLLEDQALAMDFLQCLTGVDYPPDHIAVIYHFYSYRHRHAVVLRVMLDRKAPEMETVSDLWPVAEWHERECFDLLGVRFRGNRDLRRLLLPEDWEGHPLRKDYKEPAEIAGISTTRPNPLDLLGERK